MNTIYKSILILGVGLISMNVAAQDDDLNRQVLLERDYNPTLNEATKINTAPNIFSPAIQPASGVKFLDAAPQLTLGASKIGQVASGDIRTEVPFDKQRFYLKAGGGTHGNIDGVIGVRAVDTKNDKLDLFGNYASANGNVDYAHTDFDLKKAKAKFNDMKFGVNYQHNFAPSIFTLGGTYQTLGYNYYGNPFQNLIEHIDMDTKQKVDIISFALGLRSSANSEGLLKYKVNVGYDNFKSKYGINPAIDKGPKGGIINADVDFYTALGEGNIGIAGTIVNQSFSSKENYLIADANLPIGYFGGYTAATVNPYYRLEDTAWNLTLGANASYVNDLKSKFVITPNITAQLHINEVNTLYAGVTGGVNNNTFLDILQENRYASPHSRIGYSKTIYDVNVGFKSGVIPNFEFDVFGGYKQTNDDHLYYFSPYTIDLVETNPRWGNLSQALYADVATGHFGALVKTKLIPMTTLSAKAVGYFYSVKKTEYDNKAWGRPNFTVELNADIKPIDPLTISLSYLMKGGRKALFFDSYDLAKGAKELSMKDINEFNVHAEYSVLKWLSVHARVNNIFDQKYEEQLGYTLQGMNVLGGLSLKF